MAHAESKKAGGIAVSELHTPNSPLITLRVLVRTGSINDPKGREGLNALTARMLGEGGTKELTYQQVVKTLYPWAASVQVQADKEVTVIIADVHRDHLEKFYKIFSDLVLHPRFDEEDFKRHKTDLLNALQNSLRGNDDENLGKQALNALLYANHPYRTTEIGTVEGLKAITLEDVKDFYKKMYTRDNLTVGIAGGYPKSFVRTLNADLSKLPTGKPPSGVLPTPERISDIEVLLVEKEARSTAISIGFPIDVTRADKDFYALMVANSYFGEHRTFNGVLMQRMRGLRGLNYGDYSYIERFIEEPGTVYQRTNIPRRQQHFSIWIRPVEPKNRHFALRQAVRELQQLVEQGLSEKDFELTRKFVVNYSKLWGQTQSRRLGYQLDAEFYGTKPLIEKIQDELAKLTVTDVNNAIKKHLQFKNLKVAIVTKGAEKLRDELLANTKSPITYSSPVGKEILEEDKEIEAYPLRINKERIQIIPSTELFER
jgi:zinc protease